jgi:EmrB/QacA subfamily drug resistance transporter
VTATARPLPPDEMPPAAPPPPTFTRRERVFAMVGVLLALLLAALDQTIVSTAGPAIQRDLRIAPATYPWITTAYLVASTVMVPVYGKLSDLFGRKPILLAGVAIFLAGSLLCGLAPSVLPLIAFRGVQGLGAAALFTSTFAVIADLFPPAERGKYTGFIGAVMAIASVVGPVVGGVITDAFGWHWVFFVNLPIGAVALWFIATRMPTLHLTRVAGRRPRVDVAGALALVVAVVPLLVALSLGRGARAAAATGGFAWGSWPILGMFALAAAGLVAFVLIERHVDEPLLDFGIFRDRIIGLGTMAVFLLGAGFLTAVVFLPLFLVNVIGISATRAGLTMMPLTFGVVVGSIGSGQIVARVGRYRALMLGSLLLLCAAFLVMGFTLTPETTSLGVTLRMVLVGLGIGPTFPIYTLIIQNAARPQEIGVVTAALTFARSLGQVIGVSVLGTVFAATLTGSMERNVAAALRDVPPGARALVARVVPMQGGAPDGESGPVVAFDAETARARIRASVAEGSAVLSGTTGSHAVVPDGGARGGPGVRTPAMGRPAAVAPGATPEDVSAAVAVVDRLGRGIRTAFTEATERLYRLGFFLALAALLISLGIPEIRLHSRPAAAPVE